jgi:hypothetical protein
LVKNHAEHRICAAIEGSADAEEMVGEVTTVVERFLRVQQNGTKVALTPRSAAPSWRRTQ